MMLAVNLYQIVMKITRLNAILYLFLLATSFLTVWLKLILILRPTDFCPFVGPISGLAVLKAIR